MRRGHTGAIALGGLRRAKESASGRLETPARRCLERAFLQRLEGVHPRCDARDALGKGLESKERNKRQGFEPLCSARNDTPAHEGLAFSLGLERVALELDSSGLWEEDDFFV